MQLFDEKQQDDVIQDYQYQYLRGMEQHSHT
jgi:hypothetical protein